MGRQILSLAQNKEQEGQGCQDQDQSGSRIGVDGQPGHRAGRVVIAGVVPVDASCDQPEHRRRKKAVDDVGHAHPAEVEMIGHSRQERARHQSNGGIEHLPSKQVDEQDRKCPRHCAGHADGDDVLSEDQFRDGSGNKRPVGLARPAGVKEVGDFALQDAARLHTDRGFVA